VTTEIIDYQEHGVSAPIEPHRTSEIQKHFAVQCQVGETKTEGSACPLPINPDLTTRLRESHKGSAYRAPGDRVLANDAGQPRWQETILRRQLKPAALRAGIGKIGWHTFRHTYSTMLRTTGTDIKVQQELLRHANIQTTMNVYTQAVSDQKRAANSDGVEMVLSEAKIAPKRQVSANRS
jgi:integrase